MARRTDTTQERPAMSTGVGESRPFVADPGAFEFNADNPRDVSNCTLNGQPVPEHLWNMLPYGLTDQGYAEANEGKEHARVKIIRDEFHNQINQRGDELDRDFGAYAHDPMRALADRYVPAGMHPHFLSSGAIDKEGTTRGYKICVNEKGEPVKLGTLVLGYIPEHVAQNIQRGFEEKSAEAQREMYGEDFDPRKTGGAREYQPKFSKQGEGLRSDLSGDSYASFENPGPSGSDVGLQSGVGEDFSL